MTYAMYSSAGDEAVAGLVLRARISVSRGDHQDIVQAALRKDRDEIKRTHAEIQDTEVRQAIAAALDPDWRAAYGCRFDEWLGVTPEPIAVNMPF